MLARYYSSSLGRFMAVDPGDDTHLEDPQSWNKYAYARNNPVALVDESGNFVATATGAAVGAIVGAVSAAAHGGNARQIAAAAAGGAVAGALVGSVIDTGGATLPVLVAAGGL